MLIGSLEPCTKAANVLWSTEQRQERIRRNHERMQSLGLHSLAQTAPMAVVNNQPKPKRPAAKPKERAPQQSYSLRNRAKPAGDAPQQAQPSQVILLQDSAACLYCEPSSAVSGAKMLSAVTLADLQEPDQSAQHPAAQHYDDPSVISYICQQVPVSRCVKLISMFFSNHGAWLNMHLQPIQSGQ